MAERKQRSRARRRETGPAPEDLAREIAALAQEKRAEDVVLLDLRGLSTACDFFVLATALSEPQVKAVVDHIDESLSAEGIRPWHIEGRQHRRWVLLDYVDVVAHVFHKDAREYYRLEGLWADAPREELAGPPDQAMGEEE